MSVIVEAHELEFHDSAANSHKFYRLYFLPTASLTQWGRLRTQGQFKLLTAMAGGKKLDEKMNEGYQPTVTRQFEISDQHAANVYSGIRSGFEALVSKFDQEIGTGIATGALPNRTQQRAQNEEKTQTQKEEDLLNELLAVADDLGLEIKSEPEPDGIEAKLAAAMARAAKEQQ